MCLKNGKEMLMESLNKFAQIPIIIIIGLISGVISCPSTSNDIAGYQGVDLFWRPPFVFFCFCALYFRLNILKKESNILLFLLFFFIIYLGSILFFYIGSYPGTMTISGILTILSFQIIGIKVDTKYIVFSALLMFIVGLLLQNINKDLYSISIFKLLNEFSIWQVIVFSTVGIYKMNNPYNNEKQ
jgi:hypothetical protein